MFKTAIPDTVKVGDAISRGLTVMEYAPESKASSAHRAFAKKEGLSDAAAMMYVIETNLLQRSFSDLLPSEKAAVLALRYSEMFSQGKRNDIQRIFLLLPTPETAMWEPYVKHLGIERYRVLYELRAKSRNLVRITFTLRETGGLLFLIPFIKRHRRDTMHALSAALRLLAQCRHGVFPLSWSRCFQRQEGAVVASLL